MTTQISVMYGSEKVRTHFTIKTGYMGANKTQNVYSALRVKQQESVYTISW